MGSTKQDIAVLGIWMSVFSSWALGLKQIVPVGRTLPAAQGARITGREGGRKRCCLEARAGWDYSAKELTFRKLKPRAMGGYPLNPAIGN